MILPIGDAPNPRGVPLVTWALIAVNVAVYVLVTLPLGAVRPDPEDPALLDYVRVLSDVLPDAATLRAFLARTTAYDLFVFTHGFRPVAPSVADLFTSLFLHAGLLHLAGNMLFLWIYGDNVEHRLGRGPYLLAYLATGVAATLFHAVTLPGSGLPTIGASGAISGVLGFYFLWFPRNRVRLLWLLPPFFMEVFLVPARLVLGLYLVAENVLPFLVARGESGVAYGAHIGGFVAGVAIAWMLGRREVASGRAALGEPDPESDDPAALVARLRSEGRPEAAVAVLQRLLARTPRGPERARLDAALGLVLLRDLGQPTAAYQHFAAALALGADAETTATAREGIAAIEALQKLRIGRERRRGY